MIVGERLRLRAIERDDLPVIVEWRNHPDVHPYFFEYEPLSLAVQERWFETFLSKRDEKYWIAETNINGEPVGTVALVDIDLRSRSAEIGRVLTAPGEHRRTGYGREMCNLLVGYAFGHLNLNRVSLKVFADNDGAISLYRNMGFVEEGRLREHTFSNGQYKDVLVLSMLRDEHQPQKS